LIQVSIPSRLCLFGEHQDYLGLQVIAAAVGIRFTATAVLQEKPELSIRIRSERFGALGEKNPGLYDQYTVPLDQPLAYTQKRDYFRSAVNVLRREGFPVSGAVVQLDSDIPIGKGMCSSTTMIMSLIGALVALWDERRFDPMEIARLGFLAEVAEFGEPGGMMDHYATVLGGLTHLDFADGVRPEKLDVKLGGVFILFDSLQDKDTIAVLSASKYPSLEAIERLTPYGIRSVAELAEKPDTEIERLLETLDPLHRQKLSANIENYRLQREAYGMLRSGTVDDKYLGQLLSRHQAAL